MTITIDSANRIAIDNISTGLCLAQRKDGTVIFTPDGVSSKYAEHKMPHARYSTAHDKPASGVAGRAQLEIDVRGLAQHL